VNRQFLPEFMKVFLQNGVTLAYLRRLGAWTADVERAMVFEDSGTAIQFCLEHQLPDMRIVLHFPEFRYDVHMPVKLPSMV
jgi:hypothetical protein